MYTCTYSVARMHSLFTVTLLIVIDNQQTKTNSTNSIKTVQKTVLTSQKRLKNFSSKCSKTRKSTLHIRKCRGCQRAIALIYY